MIQLLSFSGSNKMYMIRVMNMLSDSFKDKVRYLPEKLTSDWEVQ